MSEQTEQVVTDLPIAVSTDMVKDAVSSVQAFMDAKKASSTPETPAAPAQPQAPETPVTTEVLATPAPAPVETPVATEQPAPSGLSDDVAQYLKSLSGEEIAPAAPATVQTPEQPAQQEVQKIPIDPVYEHPLVKAIAESVKNGITDISQIVKSLGVIPDAQALSIADLYREKAVSLGIDGDQLETAVAQQLDYFENLTPIQKIEEERKLRSSIEEKTKEKLVQYTNNVTASQQQEQERLAKIAESANETLRQTISQKVGKLHNSLRIDENMAKALQEVAPLYAMPILDNGKVVGYDVEKGFDLAVYAMYGKEMQRSLYNYARQQGYDEAIQDKLRPNPDGAASGSTVVQRGVTREDAIRNATEQMWKQRGL